MLTFKLRYNETRPYLTQNPKADNQKTCLFFCYGRTSLVKIIDVNVRVSKVIKAVTQGVSTYQKLTYNLSIKKKIKFEKYVCAIYILTYRNNPSYMSMEILICLSVRSNTDQIRMKLRLFQVHPMCSRNRVLTYSWTS